MIPQTVEKFVCIKMTYLISTFKFRLLISIAGGQTNAFKLKLFDIAADMITSNKPINL
jgi:hypothetical protein